MTQEDLQKEIIKTAVAKLKTLGYENVTEDNILTDEYYAAAFRKLLKSSRGGTKEYIKAIDNLLGYL
jgi:hypothetical protein